MKTKEFRIITAAQMVPIVICYQTGYDTIWVIVYGVFYVVGVVSLIAWLLERDRTERLEAKSRDKTEKSSTEITGSKPGGPREE